MRITYATLFGVAALATQAQQRFPALPEHPSDRDAHRVAGPEGGQGRMKGANYYTESFDSDLNGWTVETSQGSVDWKWTNVGPGLTASTYPVPALNTSTPSGWAIIDDDFDGSSGMAVTSSLISPVIDLSSAPPNLKVEFDQYFQEFQTVATFVGVSTNGGADWNEIQINAGVGRDGRPNPELVDVNISDWIVENPANVQLRFRYDAVWDYGWQIDNIVIRDLPDNDMALNRIVNTAFDFDNTGFEFMDYSVYPASQILDMSAKGTLKNKGYLQQTGVTLNLSVDGPSGNEFDDTSAPATFAPSEETEVLLGTYTPSGNIGNYTRTYTVDQDQEDEVPADNVRTSTFQVTSNIYGHDDGVVQSFQVQNPDNADESFEVGNHFVMLQDAVLTGVQVAIHSNTPPGAAIYGALYTPGASATVHPDLVDLTATYEVTADDLSDVGESNFITLNFTTPLELLAGETFLLMAGSFDGPDNVHFATSGTSEAQISIIHYPNLDTDFEFFFTKTPMVRMVLQGDVGMDEIAENGVALGQNMPNPANGTTAITYELENTADVSFQLRDVSGKLVMEQRVGQRAPGSHRFEIAADALQEGAYFYTLTAGDVRLTKRMTVVH
jgi:hypothetical protein